MALKIYGRWLSSNSASKVEPITWTMRPRCWPLVALPSVRVAIVGISMMESWERFLSRLLLFQCLGAADDLGQLLGDLRLPCPVVLLGQAADHVFGVFRGGRHGHAAGNLLAHGRVQEAFE